MTAAIAAGAAWVLIVLGGLLLLAEAVVGLWGLNNRRRRP